MIQTRRRYSNHVGLQDDSAPARDVKESIGATSKKLDEFAKLAPRWSFGEGRSFDVAAIEAARALSEYVATLGKFEIDAFPGLEGEVHLCLYRGSTYADFALRNNKSIDFRCETGGALADEKPGITFETAKNIINRIGRNPWLSLASSIPFTSTVNVADSPTSVSSQRHSMKASLKPSR